MTKEKERPILFTKAQLKDDFGFTEKMISTLLGKPILKTNPVFKCASPMKLWAKEEVDEVMKSDEYKELKEKGYIVIPGRISRQYFNERFYGITKPDEEVSDNAGL